MLQRILFFCIGCLFLACSGEESELSGVHCSWQLRESGADGSLRALLTIHNQTKYTIDDSWMLCFSQFQAPVVADQSIARIRHVTGDYNQLLPGPQFKLMSGDSLTFELLYAYPVVNVSHAPSGMYLTSGSSTYAVDLEISGFQLPASDWTKKLYERNAEVPLYALSDLSVVFPRPENTTWGTTSYRLGPSAQVHCPVTLAREGDVLEQILEGHLHRVSVERVEEAGDINLRLEKGLGSDRYRLSSSGKEVTISGGDRAGVFYGIQTFLQLAIASNKTLDEDSITITGCTIDDGPAFVYRGQHLDVARNFHDVETVRRLIDLMAICKLNKLHLSLTNDEGWRLEIPGLPELTEIGSRRGHTDNEHNMLNPAYGSGPFPDQGSGSGYFSREDYIALIQYASARHIEIIPEIDVPGHARAAIKSMQARARRLRAQGDTAAAMEYLLHDPDDLSKYVSAQGYADNVLCICRPSVYRFIEKVFAEVALMHKAAGVPLKSLHMGGDEIPFGAWEQSPICKDYMREEGMTEINTLQTNFIQHLLEITDRLDITLAGWEEIVLRNTPEGHNTTEINTQMLSTRVRPYVWNSVIGWGREDMGYKLANAGLPTVLCNSSALYFDLAYNTHPMEPGLTWSGYVDARAAFDFIPLDQFVNASVDIDGNALAGDYYTGKEQLTESGKKNVLGIQGQLWTETLSDSRMIDYYLFPKMLALAHRAWGRQPEWVGFDDIDGRRKEYLLEWSAFAYNVGHHALPMLEKVAGGVAYHVPTPGAIVRGDTLFANVAFPGFTIHYTTDGAEPTFDSPVYKPPVVIDKPVKLRAFSGNGKGGRTVQVK